MTTITEPMKERIANAVIKNMIARKLSHRDIAATCGFKISPSQIGNIVKGKHDEGLTPNRSKWNDIGEGMWQKLASRFLTQDGVVATKNFTKILDSYEECKEEKVTNLFTGDTGAGKTTAISRIALNPNTYVVRCDSTFGPVQLVKAVASAMGISPGSTRSETQQIITERLSSEENAVLVFDSVGKLLKDAAWQWLSDIAEAIEHKAGLLLVGLPIAHHILNKRAIGNVRGFRELRRRIFSIRQAELFKECEQDCREIMIQRGINNVKVQDQILYTYEDDKLEEKRKTNQMGHPQCKVKCFGTLDSEIRKTMRALNAMKEESAMNAQLN